MYELHQGAGDLVVTEVPLTKNAEDVFDARPRRFAKQILVPKPVEIVLSAGRLIPMRKQELCVGEERSGFDDF